MTTKEQEKLYKAMYEARKLLDKATPTKYTWIVPKGLKINKRIKKELLELLNS